MFSKLTYSVLQIYYGGRIFKGFHRNTENATPESNVRQELMVVEQAMCWIFRCFCGVLGCLKGIRYAMIYFSEGI